VLIPGSAGHAAGFPTPIHEVVGHLPALRAFSCSAQRAECANTRNRDMRKPGSRPRSARGGEPCFGPFAHRHRWSLGLGTQFRIWPFLPVPRLSGSNRLLCNDLDSKLALLFLPIFEVPFLFHVGARVQLRAPPHDVAHLFRVVVLGGRFPRTEFPVSLQDGLRSGTTCKDGVNLPGVHAPRVRRLNGGRGPLGVRGSARTNHESVHRRRGGRRD
jgi:hypothetical protein